jgi:hypothetical protein
LARDHHGEVMEDAGMSPIRTAVLAATFLAAALPPALAGSQSSNSSSNCSDGRCSRVESYREEGRGERWGITRIERWHEAPRASSRGWWPLDRRAEEAPRRHEPRRRHRRDDD